MHKTKLAIWLDILVLTAAVGIGSFLILVLPGLLPNAAVVPDDIQDVVPPVLCTEVQQGRLPGYEDAATNETNDYFWYLFNSAVTFEDSASPGNVLLENTPGNTCNMVVTYTLSTGLEVYRSPVIHPGEHLQYGYLARPLSAGTYPVEVTILVYSVPEEPGDDAKPDEEQEAASGTSTEAGESDAKPDEPIASYTEKGTLIIG